MFVNNFNKWLSESIRDKMVSKTPDEIKEIMGEETYVSYINLKDRVKKLENEIPTIDYTTVIIDKVPWLEYKYPVALIYTNIYCYRIETHKDKWQFQVTMKYNKTPLYQISTSDWSEIEKYMKETYNEI